MERNLPQSVDEVLSLIAKHGDEIKTSIPVVDARGRQARYRMQKEMRKRYNEIKIANPARLRFTVNALDTQTSQQVTHAFSSAPATWDEDRIAEALRGAIAANSVHVVQLLQSPGTQHSLCWYTKTCAVTLAFTTMSNPTELPPQASSFRDLCPATLCQLTGEVRITHAVLKPKKSQRSAVFTPEETVAILGNEWPSEDNLNNIERSVNERKAYPMPGYVPPPEKSFIAQGQTKKLGSHSESRHQRR